MALAVVAIVMRDGPPGLSISWLWMLLLSLSSFAGMYALYRSFSVGTLSIVSPIAAGYAVVTGILALTFSESPPGLVLAGAALMIAGVVVVSRGTGGGAATVAGVPEALLAALFLGIFFWGLDHMTEQWGWLWPVIVNRLVELVCAFGILSRTPGGVSLRPEIGTGKLLFLAAMLETGALVSFDLGLERTFTTTTTALGSLYSAVAILLAWFILKERLAKVQWAGIAGIMTGVLLVSV
jgi:drug/metabolite transporter (DMT)-like permease